MLDLSKKSPLFLRTIEFFGYFDCVYFIEIDKFKKWEQCSCSHHTAELGMMHVGNMRAPHVSLPMSLRLSRAEQAVRRFCEVEKPLAFKIKSANVLLLVDEQWASFLSQISWNWSLCNTTYLFTQANPESTALKIYFTLCLIYIQKNISRSVATCLFIGGGT